MAEQVAVVEDALVIGGWRVERINEDGECRVAVFSGPGAGEDARFFAVTYGYGDDLRAELAATQQALGETAAAMREVCGCPGCYFQWPTVREEHHGAPFYRHTAPATGTYLYCSAARGDGGVRAALANPIVQEALAAWRKEQGQ